MFYRHCINCSGFDRLECSYRSGVKCVFQPVCAWFEGPHQREAFQTGNAQTADDLLCLCASVLVLPEDPQEMETLLCSGPAAYPRTFHTVSIRQDADQFFSSITSSLVLAMFRTGLAIVGLYPCKLSYLLQR